MAARPAAGGRRLYAKGCGILLVLGWLILLFHVEKRAYLLSISGRVFLDHPDSLLNATSPSSNLFEDDDDYKGSSTSEAPLPSIPVYRPLPWTPSSPSDVFPWLRGVESMTEEAVHKKMEHTRRYVLARYDRYLNDRQNKSSDLVPSGKAENGSQELSAQLRRPHTIGVAGDTIHMSDKSLSEVWPQGLEGTWVMSCADFEPYCEYMSSTALIKYYEQLYIPPRFLPSMKDVVEVYARGYVLLADGLSDNTESNKIRDMRRGNNTQPPEVAIIFDGWVGSMGSVLSEDILLSPWPDSSTIDNFNESYLQRPEHIRRVKEVAVISHLHHGMYWHAMVSEFYRIFAMLPFLQANDDIYIHLGPNQNFGTFEFLYPLLNISRDRLILGETVKADIIYLTQPINRNDIPSLGLTQLIRQRIWDNMVMLQPPEPWSAIGFASESAQNPRQRDINILLIVRNNPDRGRMIVNYDQLKAELQRLARNPASPRRDSKRNIRIHLLEHMPNMSIFECAQLYSQADIVIGPHGAGFAHLFAVRPGAHVIEFITSRHLNLYNSARLGIHYHGIAAPLANTSDMSQANFEPNLPQLQALVQSILASRFE